jgi:hypothetical protein
MATWAEFQASAPELATAGRALLYRDGDGSALLATVCGGSPPRIHPITLEIVNGSLYAFILRSAKLTDLVEDGRYALHAHVDPAAPSEFMIRGRAREVTDPGEREAVASGWPFTADEAYRLFVFDVDSALLGERPDAHAWPPAYRRWTAPG